MVKWDMYSWLSMTSVPNDNPCELPVLECVQLFCIVHCQWRTDVLDSTAIRIEKLLATATNTTTTLVRKSCIFDNGFLVDQFRFWLTTTWSAATSFQWDTIGETFPPSANQQQNELICTFPYLNRWLFDDCFSLSQPFRRPSIYSWILARAPLSCYNSGNLPWPLVHQRRCHHQLLWYLCHFVNDDDAAY